LRSEFDFDDVARLTDYLTELGVSHVYTSPYLQATPGSTHGYDIVDHSHPNDELGGEAGRKRMTLALIDAGLGQLVDIVPNHMAVGSAQNRLWWDVLTHGQRSKCAAFFDIDWNVDDARRGRVVLPVLGDTQEVAISQGDIKVALKDGVAVIQYLERCFPLSEKSLGNLDLTSVNSDADRLVELLDMQHYRLEPWKGGGARVNYRRFFDVNELAALRVEEDTVFARTHEQLLSWLDEGVVDGVRIDHIDGLRDPEAYLHRLRGKVGTSKRLLVEKILEAEESIPDSWPVEGTTGYDGARVIDGLFIDATNAIAFRELTESFTGSRLKWKEVVEQSKQLVVEEILSSDVARLTECFVAVCKAEGRDVPRTELRRAIEALLMAFPVYRTYVTPSKADQDARDRSIILGAVSAAEVSNGAVDPSLLRFLGEVLLLDIRGAECEELAARFQQLSGPVMAKGVEDTAFYRYNTFVALNEVGGDPGRFGVGPEEFHRWCGAVQRHAPETMLASTTHDTKRSEDVRHRLALLSEIPAQWSETVTQWSAMAQRYRTADDGRGGTWPDPNDEYLFYQTLVGAYPLSIERATAYMVKATKEAKTNTSWADANLGHDMSLAEFVGGVLSDRAYCENVERFVDPLVEPGRVNSLAATLLKLTCPGVPDIYQGTERWTLSLVDPDNRRLVDYGVRRRMLKSLKAMSVDAIVAGSDEGYTKCHVIHEALKLRSRRPHAFDRRGDYEPMSATGAAGAHVVAFCRSDEAITIVPRLVLGLSRKGGWRNTSVPLPNGSWRNVFTGDVANGGSVLVGHLLREFPVALLERTA